MNVESRRGLLISRAWVQAVLVVFCLGFLVLGFLAYQPTRGSHPFRAW
jgi:hypothetical protein